MRFTSAASHVTIASNGLDVLAGDFTAELWLKLHSDFVAAATGAILMGNEQTLVSDLRVSLSNGMIRCDVTTTTPDGTGEVAATFPSDAAWHHVACVRDSGILKVFVDGAEHGRKTNMNVVSSSSGWSLGVPAGNASYFSAPVVLGPIRISRVARYARPFVPRSFWAIDADTLAQYLTVRGFDGASLHDEAGGDNDGTGVSGVAASQDVPCP